MGQLEDMQLFVRVVEAGGISKAADGLGLAKSAVSRRLAELEKKLGVKLIQRTTRTSGLTEIGQSYFLRARQVLDDINELNGSIADARQALTGTLKLAVPLSFGLCHLTAAIEAFISEHPGVTIHVDFSDRQVDLIEEGLDLALRIADLKDSNLIARQVCPINFILGASPEYLAENGTPLHPDELKNHRLLYYSANGNNPWRFIDRQSQVHSLNVQPTMVANNGDFLKNMAIAGQGIVYTPTFISWQAIEQGLLVPLLPDYTLPRLTAYAVYPQNRYLSLRIRTLIDFLVRRFGQQPYWDAPLEGCLRR